MSKGITILSYRLSSFTLYRRAFVQAQKESISDSASVHANKGDFGPKKPLGVTWVNFCRVCAAGLSEPLPHYFVANSILFMNWPTFLCNLQYIGETKCRLKDRFNEHRRPILNPIGNYTHTAVSEHFLTSNHSDDHILLFPIEKLKNGRDSFRKAREVHLIHKAKTIDPLGINKRDEL